MFRIGYADALVQSMRAVVERFDSGEATRH